MVMLVILLSVTRVVIRMIRIIGITRTDSQAWSVAPFESTRALGLQPNDSAS